jgi:hypothetical protein
MVGVGLLLDHGEEGLLFSIAKGKTPEYYGSEVPAR